MTEAETSQSALKLRKLIEACRVLNSTLDLDRLLVLIVDLAVQSVGADRGTLYLVDAARGELWSKVLLGADLKEIRLPPGKGIAGHVARTGEALIIPDAHEDPRFNPEIDRLTGYRTRSVLALPLRDQQGSVIGVFQLLNKEGGFDSGDAAIIDALSAQASIAIEHARLAREMVQQERLSAVGRMASGLVHDFKGPLGTLRLDAELLMRRARDAESAGLAEEIIRQADRITAMAQEILDFTRGTVGVKARAGDLGALMDGFLDSASRELERSGIRLERELLFRGTVHMDGNKLLRAFHNLVANARDAMPGGGRLRVRTAAAGGRVAVEFTDTGGGMTEEVRRRIGEPFFTHGKAHGTGLGMAMVKKIVEEHRGAVEVESSPGAGTTVRILLPAP